MFKESWLEPGLEDVLQVDIKLNAGQKTFWGAFGEGLELIKTEWEQAERHGRIPLC